MMNETVESHASNFNSQQNPQMVMGSVNEESADNIGNYNTSVVETNQQSFMQNHMNGGNVNHPYQSALGEQPMGMPNTSYGVGNPYTTSSTSTGIEISSSSDMHYSAGVNNGVMDQSTDILADTGSEQDSSMISNSGMMGGGAGDSYNNDVEGGQQMNNSIDSAPKPFDPSQLGYSMNDSGKMNNDSYNRSVINTNNQDSSTMGSSSENMMDPKKVGSHDSTVDMMHSPTMSGEGLSPNEFASASASASEIARRQKRKRALRCYLLTGIIVMILAIGIPLGAVMIFSGNSNNNNADSSTLDSTTQQAPNGGSENDLNATMPGTDIVFDPGFSANTTVFVDTPLAQDVADITNEQGDSAPEHGSGHTSGPPPENEVTGTIPPADETPAFENPFPDSFTSTEEPMVNPSEEVVGMNDGVGEDTTTTLTNPSDTVGDDTMNTGDVGAPADVPADVPLEPIPQEPALPPPLVDESYIPDDDFIYPTLLTMTLETALRDGTTPQGRAYRWLTTLDRITPSDLELLPQRYVVTALDFSVHNMNHASFVNPDAHECSWEGITCNNRQQVTGIKWNNYNLTGQVIPELRYIGSSLTTLDLAENELTGNLDSVWFLPDLQNVYMHHNQFSGSITPMIGQLTSLENLYLSHNQLTGVIPYNMASAGGVPKPLRYLVLSHNRLSGNLPYNFRLRSLFYLDLGYNQLGGPLPQDWDMNMVSLRHLWLDHNRLTGPVPDNFGNLGRGRLRQLYLNDNLLTGALPNDWSSDGFLSNINLIGNSFTGRLDDSLCGLNVFQGGEMIELRTQCDICRCEYLCQDQCEPAE